MVDVMKIEDQCIAIAKQFKATFLLKGNPITNEEIFSPNGLLPVIAKRADQLAFLCFNHGIDISINEQQRSKLGKTVIFEATSYHLIRLLCLTDVLCEIAKSKQNGKINLDELLID